MINLNWLQFQEAIEKLKEHPLIVVKYFNIFPPVSQAIILTVEQSIGHVLPQRLKEFYMLTNGLELGWHFKALPHQKQQHTPLDGNIKIKPFEKVFQGKMTEQLDTTFVFEECNDIDKVTISWQAEKKPTWQLYLQNQTENSIPFSTYFQHLTATCGFTKARSTIFKFPDLSHQTKWDLDQLAIHHYFPQSDRAGANTQNLKTQQMQQKAENETATTTAQLEEIVAAHHQFLNNGGAGGRWKTFHVSGLVFGVYIGGKSEKGVQANFEQKKLSSLSLDTIGLVLPFTTFIGMYAKYQDFSEADFSYSIFTDAMLEKAIFAEANLEYCDFSRANLRGVSFMNANLKGVDFENCDLTNADFRGANWQGAKFPGAILKNIQF